jgi:glucosamine-6-phosphate deaminase
MQVIKCDDKQELGRRAADEGAQAINAAIERDGGAGIIVATGASQFEVLENLVQADVDWSRVTAFHLDEYVGMPISHPASFRKYLKERFVERLPRPLLEFHYINGENDAEKECERLNKIIAGHEIAVAFVGIGENGHLAFNDPPADFETEKPYLVVDLDADCRRQQFGEGWFPSLEDVPAQAISMSIQQIMKSQQIVCSVPDERKAAAVKKCVQGPVTPLAPASILQQHERASIYLDPASASQLS